MDALERFRRFFEEAPLGMAIISQDLTLIDINSTMCAMLGYTREQIVGVPLMDVVHPDSRQETRDGYRKLIAGEIGLFKAERRYIRKSGELRWGSSTVSAVRDDAGKFLYFLSLIEDITDRKNAELALSEAHARYERLFTSMMDAFGAIDLERRIVEYNEPFRSMIGYGPEEIATLTLSDITPPRWHAFENNIIENQVMTRGFSDVYQKEFRKKDGTVFPVELRAFLLRDQEGKPIGIWAIVRDITERKRAETMLVQSEQRMQALIENAPFGAHEYDLTPDGKLIFKRFNPAANRILKVDCSQFIGKTIEEAFPPLIATPVPDAYRRVAATGKRYEDVQVDYHAGRISGAFEISAFQTAPNRMAVFFRDITERKQEEEERRKAELLFRTLIESSPEAILVSDREKALYANPAIVRLFKVPENQIVGQNIWEHIAPENRERAKRRVDQVMNGMSAPAYETWIDLADGTRIYVETSGTRIFFQGEPAIMTFFHDTTARKKAQDRQEHLESVLGAIRAINQMILKADSREEVLHRSCETFVRIRDFSSACAVLADEQQTFAFSKNPVSQSVFVKETGCLLAARKMLSENEKIRLLDAGQAENPEPSVGIRMEFGGKAYGVLIVTLPRIFAEDPEEQSLLCEVADDIAFALYRLELEAAREQAMKKIEHFAREMELSNQQLLKTNRDLDAANARLMELDEMKSEFVALASHELRTPMTSILGYAQTLLSGRVAADEACRVRFLKVIEAESKRLARLVGDLLDLTRIEKGSLPFTFKPVDIGVLLSSIKEAMNWPADCPFEIRNELPPQIRARADPDRLAQAIRNLLENALRVTPKGHGVVLSAASTGEYIRLAISDTGPGIRAADQGKIFEKFYRVRDEKSPSSGSGLGLPIALDIVKAHGGRLWVESREGSGSTFFLTIPVYKE